MTTPRPQVPEPQGEPRLERPERHQMAWEAVDLDSLIPLDHRARLVWEYVEELDLSLFLVAIKAVEGHSGRPATDPAVLAALWLYATLEGVGSARALERLCREHNANRPRRVTRRVAGATGSPRRKGGARRPTPTRGS